MDAGLARGGSRQQFISSATMILWLPFLRDKQLLRPVIMEAPLTLPGGRFVISRKSRWVAGLKRKAHTHAVDPRGTCHCFLYP